MGGGKKNKNTVTKKVVSAKVIVCGHRFSGKSTFLNQILSKGERLIDDKAIAYMRKNSGVELKFHEFRRVKDSKDEDNKDGEDTNDNKDDKEMKCSMDWAKDSCIGVLVVSGRFMLWTTAESKQTKNYLRLLRSLWLEDPEKGKVRKLVVLLSHHDVASFMEEKSKKAVRKELVNCGYKDEVVKFFTTGQITQFLDCLTNIVSSTESCLRVDCGAESAGQKSTAPQIAEPSQVEEFTPAGSQPQSSQVEPSDTATRITFAATIPSARARTTTSARAVDD